MPREQMMGNLYEVIDGPGCWNGFEIGDIIEPLGGVLSTNKHSTFSKVVGERRIWQTLYHTQIKPLELDLENK